MSAGTLSTHAIAGWTFKATARTAAHLEWTIAELKRLHPRARLVILQACYSDPVRFPLSAGTHDYDAVFDFRIEGLGSGTAGWWAGQKFLRSKGWAAWYRHTGSWAASSRWHHHAISLGFPDKVGYYVDGGVSLYGERPFTSQVDDYYRHSLGLKGQHSSGLDTSWFPASISDTIFRYGDWLAKRNLARSTFFDISVALLRLSERSERPETYLQARSLIGKYVTNHHHVYTPKSTTEVLRALASKRASSSNYWTKRRLTRAINLLKTVV